jgi:hypothetical protein
MKRATQIAKELNIGFNTLKQYLEKLGVELDNPNQKIDDNTELIIKELNEGKTIVSVRGKIELDKPNHKIDDNTELIINELNEGKTIIPNRGKIVEYNEKETFYAEKPNYNHGIRFVNSISFIDIDDEKRPINYKKNSSKKSSHKVFNHSPKEISTSELIPPEFNVDNPYQENSIEIASDSNIFANRSTREVTFEDLATETIFSDFEAISICYGLSDGHARFIANKWFKTQEFNADVVEAHFIAMKAMEKYGTKLLSFIIGLPPLPFKALDVKEIFSELDGRKHRSNFPVVRILFENAKGNDERLQISFYTEDGEDGKVRFENVLTVRNNSTGKPIMKITRDGRIVPEPYTKNIVPIIKLFLQFSTDTERMILNYGLETGCCSICGRELTVEESIRRGIGPVCAQNTLK